MIEFQVLGVLDLRGPEGEEILSVLSQPKRVALLCYLAVATPRGFHRRDKLVRLFWPESEQDRARASLRASLHHLRRSLGGDVVLGRGDEEVGLNWGLFQCDVVAFEEAAEGDPQKALELYRGDLLEGFFLSDCPEFEHWLEGERGRLREAVSGAAWSVAHYQIAAGEFTEAERTGQRALALLSTDEAEVRRLIEALAAAGDGAAAVRFYERFVQLLDHLLNLGPSGETKALVDAIRESASTHVLPSDPPPGRPPFPPAEPLPSVARTEAAAPSLSQRLRERKLFHWTLAYLAGAWVVYEATGAALEAWNIPVPLVHAIHVLLLFGLPVTLVVAWRYGEKGRRRVIGPELLMGAALLVVAGVALSTLGGPGETASVPRFREGDDRPGVAVLPCANLSTHPDDEYLAAALHDEILLKLQGISSLFSIGRASVEWYRDHPAPLTTVAAELGVGFVGECSVQKSQNQIRLIFQLQNGATGGQVWAKNYDRDLTLGNLLDIQSDVARQVAHAVGAVLAGEEQARIETLPTTNLDAYELYLLGRNRWTTRSPETIREAIDYFEAAIELDSTFVLAFTGVADAYMSLPVYDVTVEALDVYEQAETAATRAYELDPSLGEVHASLGYLSHNYELDWERAERHFAAAVDLAPGHPTAHHRYGNFLACVGRFDEAVAEMEKALSLDPRSNALVSMYADKLRRAGRISEARARFEQAISMERPSPWAFHNLALTLALDKPTDLMRAGELLAELVSLFGYPFPDRVVTVVEALSGIREARVGAVAVLDDLLERTHLERADLTPWYCALAPADVCFEVLDEAVELRHPWVTAVPTWYPHRLQELRRDPRWQQFLTRIGYPGSVE